MTVCKLQCLHTATPAFAYRDRESRKEVSLSRANHRTEISLTPCFSQNTFGYHHGQQYGRPDNIFFQFISLMLGQYLKMSKMFCFYIHFGSRFCFNFPFCLHSKPSREMWHVTSEAVLLQGWGGPDCSRKLRFPDFISTAQDGGKIVSLTHRPPLPLGNALHTHFC